MNPWMKRMSGTTAALMTLLMASPGESLAQNQVRRLMPEAVKKVVRLTPKPVPLNPIGGAFQLYRRSANGLRQLASNIAVGGEMPRDNRQPPRVAGRRIYGLIVNSERTVVRFPNYPLMLGACPQPRPVALVAGIWPDPVVQGDTIYIWGGAYDDTVWVKIEYRDNPTLFSQWYELPAVHASDVGDYVAWTVPPGAPSGNYSAVVLNLCAPAASNPGFFTVRAPYPTSPYIVARTTYLSLPDGFDNAKSSEYRDGEVSFSFASSTSTAGVEPSPQTVIYGDNDTHGFSAPRSGLQVDAAELQLPIFSMPRSLMGDALLITAGGQEFDDASSNTGWQLVGRALGFIAAGYFLGPEAAGDGGGLGGDIADQLSRDLVDAGNDALGAHRNKFLPYQDYGIGAADWPPLTFDPENANGRRIKLGYTVHAIDAPRVNRVQIRLDRIDTTRAGVAPGGKFYVRARAFDGPVGIIIPGTLQLAVSPDTTPSATALPSPSGLLHNRSGSHDMPFVYAEISLWYVKEGIHQMIGRTYSRLFWPGELLQTSTSHLESHVADTVAPTPGHGMPGAFAVYYTIIVDR